MCPRPARILSSDVQSNKVIKNLIASTNRFFFKLSDYCGTMTNTIDSFQKGSALENYNIWIDCDPGHDDVVALTLAACAGHCKILGVSTVHGNTTLEFTTKNALAVMELLNQDVDVHAGAAKPLMRESAFATHIHGTNGLAGISLLPDYPKKKATPDAVFAMYTTISNYPEPVTLVATGPLTNIALLLATYPSVTDNIERFIFMGGSTGIGNITSQAEFNVYADPEAARLVLETKSLIGKLFMVPLDVTHKVLLDANIIQLLRQHSNPFSSTLVELMTVFQQTYENVYGIRNGVPVHDVCAVALALWPSLWTSRSMYVTVSLDSLTLGRTVCDVWSQQNQYPANVHVVLEADVSLFWETFIGVIDRLNYL